MSLTLIYLLTGAFAGTAAGMFGISGGIVIIPILIAVLPQANIPHALVIKVVMATSLATVALAYIRIVYLQWRKYNIAWSVVQKTFFPSVLGSIFAVLIAYQISGYYLSWLFSILLIVFALRMLLTSNLVQQSRAFPPWWQFYPLTFLLAMGSAIIGLGGGVFFVPYLHYCGLTMLRSVGTASICTLTIATVASLSYASLSIITHEKLSHSLGYIYLPAFFAISLTSIGFVGLGLKLGHYLSPVQLKKGFALLLLIIAVKMICYTTITSA